MSDPTVIKLLSAMVIELRIANDLKAVELDVIQNRFGDESCHVETKNVRAISYERFPEIRELFGVKR